ncbi:MAG: sulfatase-like hydrolase/transferase, partial [Verrucomicrobiota bacterium]
GGGIPITGSSGNWADIPFDFSDFTSAMRVAFTSQGNGGGSLDLASVRVIVDADSDGDGMPDSWDDANGLNKNDPADAEDDNDAVGGADGLTNLEEFLARTNPQDADSDDDALLDGDEVNGTLNPWTAGVFGSPPGDPTDPNNIDSDGDGETDGFEIANGTDPNAPPPNTGPLFPFVDTDGDGYRDEAETAFGSNPGDALSCPDHRPNPARPNLVVIYADDMGLGDMSAYGTLFGTAAPADTPRMDSLASQGVLFTQAHSGSAVCTPSRYALLTGKYNWREFNSISSHYGVGPISDIPRPGDTTIAEFLQAEGYDTAAFGKWHLGGTWFRTNSNTRITGNPSDPSIIDWARPVEDHAVAHGFDLFRGLATTINFGPYVFLEDDRMQYWDITLNGGTGAFRQATNGDTFQWFTTAELNASVVGNKDSRASLGDPSYRQVDAGPIMIDQVEDYLAGRVGNTNAFFAYVALYSPHLPWALTAPFIGTNSGNGFYYGDWMPEVDDRIGELEDEL